MRVGGRAAMPDARGKAARTVMFRERVSTVLAAAAHHSSGAKEAAHGEGARAAEMEGAEAAAVGRAAEGSWQQCRAGRACRV